MYFGGSPGGAQGWHWGNHAPNTGGSNQYGPPAFTPETLWSAIEQQELHHEAHKILAKYGVHNYWLAMELIDKISSLRDRQRGTVDDMFTALQNRQQ